jgi:hypothetical protein
MDSAMSYKVRTYDSLFKSEKALNEDIKGIGTKISD